jgi:uncharacterized Tic20 family protein
MPDDQIPPPIQLSQPPPPLAVASRARTWNMFCHLSALSGYVGLPFGNFLGPFLVWQIKKHEISSVEAHAKAALNFQLTVFIALVAGGAAAFLLSFFCVGFLLIPVVGLIALCGIIFPIIAAVKANDGVAYKYPCSLELIK